MRIIIPIKWAVVFSILVALGISYIVPVFSAEYQSGTVPLNFTVAQLVSITRSAEMINGIIFGSVNPNSNGNPARNNSNYVGGTNSTAYNFTVDASSTSSAMFNNKLTASITCTGGTCTYNVGGSSTGNWTEFSTNSTFDDTEYTAIGNCGTIAAGSNCWTKYYLDVSSGVSSGDYGGATAYTWCGNATTGSTTCS